MWHQLANMLNYLIRRHKLKLPLWVWRAQNFSSTLCEVGKIKGRVPVNLTNHTLCVLCAIAANCKKKKKKKDWINVGWLDLCLSKLPGNKQKTVVGNRFPNCTLNIDKIISHHYHKKPYKKHTSWLQCFWSYKMIKMWEYSVFLQARRQGPKHFRTSMHPFSSKWFH